ncbi:type I DNA topoisomerase [Usitatibacter palustris]|uniref:DNA topoisomerase 1 n=1 Tax=Usitatibacter palustris TaxID=2732487 RepID=A0A6M4H1K6_9PROT|nr:type I DNA topoisomerase [Usitatibacter palustris]QJR13222.1 DNA topoisomerase 1 [Usitatibacter palustris]
MTTHLLIVESPSKAKTLKKYLGKDYEVLASYGHVRDLVPKTGAVDPDDNFRMQYELIDRNTKHVDNITRAVKDADVILLATDPDREGEAIAWHLSEILKSRKALKDKKIKRVVFYEITEGAVTDAVKNPRAISMDLVNAQQARRALDYLVGFNLSPLLWKKIRRGLSAGRVQSPALRLICERENEIEAFKSQEYWTLHFDGDKDKVTFTARLTHFEGEKLDQFAVPSAERNGEIIAFLQSHAKGVAKVREIEKKRRLKSPAAPFTTSTLQQEAVRKLGFSTDRAMKVAQSLYEGVNIGRTVTGLITYMRTDSVTLSKEAMTEIRGFITKNYGADHLPKAPVFYANKTKNAQEAHEAIRPTSVTRTPDSVSQYLNDEQRKLYEMIWKRTVSSQMMPAQFDTVAVDFNVGGDGNVFRATGQTMIFPGFYAVYHEDQDDSPSDDEEKRLPAFKQGDVVDITKLYGEQHFTQPPPRFSEASLVKALEQYGIGRPSTYASIISTLQKREYVILDKKRFTPTDVGRVVNKFLSEHFAHWVDYEFTAKMEDELDDISNGKEEWIPVLEKFWKDFSAQIGEKESVSRKDVTQEQLDEVCPKCGKHKLTIRLGRRGRFIGCPGYPECDYTRNVDGSDGGPANEKREIGVDPVTGKLIQLLFGPFGPYLQLGEMEGDKKPKRVSVPKNILPDQVNFEIAEMLLALPRDLGAHPEDKKKVIANIGRFGPYVSHDGQFKSIPKAESVFDITLERAVALLKEPKAAGGRGALKVLGKHPEDGQAVSLYAGKYGPYVKHGKVNATLPDEKMITTVTLEEAIELLAAKAGKGKKKPAKTKAAPKAAAPPKLKAAAKAKPKAKAKASKAKKAA